MSCNDGGECGNCDNCPEKAAEEGKKALELWKSIFKKVLATSDGDVITEAFTREETELVSKQLKDFEDATE